MCTTKMRFKVNVHNLTNFLVTSNIILGHGGMHVISLFLQEGISITPLVSKQGPYFKYLFFHHLFFSSSDSLNLQTFMLKGQEQNIH